MRILKLFGILLVLRVVIKSRFFFLCIFNYFFFFVSIPVLIIPRTFNKYRTQMFKYKVLRLLSWPSYYFVIFRRRETTSRRHTAFLPVEEQSVFWRKRQTRIFDVGPVHASGPGFAGAPDVADFPKRFSLPIGRYVTLVLLVYRYIIFFVSFLYFPDNRPRCSRTAESREIITERDLKTQPTT